MNKDYKMSPKSLKYFVMTTLCLAVVILMATPLFSQDLSTQREQQIGQTVIEVYSSGEFSQFKDSSSYIEKVKQYIREKIQEARDAFQKWLMQQLKNIHFNAPIPKNSNQFNFNIDVIRIIAIILLIGLFGTILWIAWRKFGFSKRTLMKADDQILEEMIKNPDTLYQKALDYEKSKEYALAIRCLYLSYLLKLNEKDLIRINKAKTNRQYLAELRMNAFREINNAEGFTKTFNDIWYGRNVAEKDDFDRWFAHYQSCVTGGVL